MLQQTTFVSTTIPLHSNDARQHDDEHDNVEKDRVVVVFVESELAVTLPHLPRAQVELIQMRKKKMKISMQMQKLRMRWLL